MTETPKTFPQFVRTWNGLSELGTPRHHRTIAGWLEAQMQGGGGRMLLMAFRGSGKSTLVGLFAAWLLYRDPNRRLLVLAADLKLAKKMVRNVKRVLERHPDTRHLKPPARERDQWAADQFTVTRPMELRDPSMIASGIGGNITGSRADVVICDDVEVPRNADSAAKRADLRERLAELDYVLVPGGAQLYVGTPHSYYTIYADEPRTEAGESAPFLDGFARLVLPVYTEDAAGRRTYAWPRRFDEAHVNRIRKATGPAKFTSQMLLRPVNTVEGRLDADLLGRYDAELDYREALGRAVLTLGGVRLASASCWWDPAFARPRGRGRRPAIPASSPPSSAGRTGASTCTGCSIWRSIPPTRRPRPNSSAGRSSASCRSIICRRSIWRSTASAASCPACCAPGSAGRGWPPRWWRCRAGRRRPAASWRPSTPCWPTGGCSPTARCGRRRWSARCGNGGRTAATPAATTGWTRSPAA
ncbi:phage terminase large subunit [Azospirillum thermophilum]|uniref:phage terminase large subunit n=1 Tax=Azospirillum thermophilum TaxID=2202148 RepID=UPI0026A69DBA